MRTLMLLMASLPKWIVSLLLGGCTIAAAQDNGSRKLPPETGRWLLTQQGVGAPQVISKVEPRLSQEALAAGWAGTIHTAMVIGADGLVYDAYLFDSPGFGMDEEIAETLKKWVFRPGVKEGKPVPVSISLEFTFPEATYRVGNGVSAPQIISRVNPEYTRRATLVHWWGTVVARLVVGVEGQPRDIQIVSSPGFGLDEEVIAALRQWRFKPGQKDGSPVATVVSVGIDFKTENEFIDDVNRDIASTSPLVLDKGKPILAAKYVGDKPPVSVSLSLTVNTNGKATDIKVVGWSDHEPRLVSQAMSDEAIHYVQNWTFEPGKDLYGKRVAVSGTVQVWAGQPPK